MPNARHRAIRRLLSEHSVATQADLIRLLEAEQIYVTQATVSRDLNTMGAVRQIGADGPARYRIGSAVPVDGSHRELARALDEYVLQITPTGGLVVVGTLPGAAHVVGRAIDESNVEGVVGTVAGDDTVLVVGGQGIEGESVADRLEAIGGTV
ncbi:MAG: arginine repressor [Acidimicrobiia bacterium]|nr:MAG: arginine repressor [Acidimicrobiia bacterium]